MNWTLIIRAVVLWCTIGFGLFHLSIAQPPLERVAIRGRVISDETGEPISNARILLTELRRRVKWETKSNADGTFAFENVMEGSYKISVSHPRYASVNFEVQAGIDMKPLTIKLTMPWPLNVTVLAHDGKPVVNAVAFAAPVQSLIRNQVIPWRVANATHMREYATDARGCLHMLLRFPGEYRVFVIVPGIGYGVSNAFRAEKRKRVPPLQVKLQRGMRIKLRYVDAKTKMPLSGLTVAVSSIHNGLFRFAQGIGWRAVTDDAGVATVEGIPPGVYRLSTQVGMFRCFWQEHTLCLLPGMDDTTVEVECDTSYVESTVGLPPNTLAQLISPQGNPVVHRSVFYCALLRDGMEPLPRLRVAFANRNGVIYLPEMAQASDVKYLFVIVPNIGFAVERLPRNAPSDVRERRVIRLQPFAKLTVQAVDERNRLVPNVRITIAGYLWDAKIRYAPLGSIHYCLPSGKLTIDNLPVIPLMLAIYPPRGYTVNDRFKRVQLQPQEHKHITFKLISRER